MKGLKTVGVREFREDLATYLHSDEPIAVTRHGQTVGIFIPTDPEHSEARWTAFEKAAARLDAILEKYGITEDEVIDEFERLRRESRQTGR
jgi:antitoxin (DNA-binding transcriptional repressor) of toxin-antitoxin stability system